jgi:integrase
MPKNHTTTATPDATPQRPVWPYPDIVKMTAHAGSGQWRKRLGKKDFYFGPIGDPAGALSRWRQQWERIKDGLPRIPATPTEGTTMLELATHFLAFKTSEHVRQHISHATLLDYRLACKKLLRAIDGSAVVNRLTPDDFGRVMLSLSNLSTIKRLNTIIKMRSVFGYGEKNGLIDAPRYGTQFNPPPQSAIRKDRNNATPKVYTAAQVHKMIEAANPQLRAMLWLGINCGIGNHDVATLEKKDIDLKKRWLVSRRKKTQAIRRTPLWPETVAAIQAAMSDDSVFVFQRADGLPLYRKWDDDVLNMTTDLLASLKLPGGFYWLRHTFATVAENVGDDHASKIIMGHVIDGVHEGYVWKFPTARLQRVSQHVYRWLAKARKDRRLKAGVAANAASES